MSFISWLENVPKELKSFFTNPVVAGTITGALGVVSIVDPALAPLLGGISAAVAKAEALAAAANVQTGSGAQKLAMALADSQAVFAAYEQQTGVTVESAQQIAIVNAIVAVLNQIPGGGVQTQVVSSTTTAPTPAAISTTGTIAPAKTTTATQVASSTLL